MGYLFSWASLSKTATERWLDASEITILVCGLVLAFGAAGEYIEEHGTLPRWMKSSRQPKMIFVWMVALSLVGEFVGDAGVFVFSGHLQTINDGEVAALNREAGDARRDAGNANREAGLARKDAATLGKQAEDERLARVEIEDRVAPRRLTATQRASVKSNLGRFAGQNFVAFHNTDLESSVFSGELASALAHDVRWKVPPNVSVGGNSAITVTSDPSIPQTGVLISATRDDASQRASSALIHELINNGFDCSRGEEFVKGATGPVTQPLIYIHVLARPEGPQGEAKVRAQKAKKP